MNTDAGNESLSSNNTSIAASELNNLLEVISGTSAAIENIWEGNDGAQQYFEMLRVSIDRAAKVTARLVKQAGGSDKKVVLHPELDAQARQKPPEPPPTAKRRALLVVDDEPMALILSKRILSEAGFDVVTAESGFECLDIFRNDPGRFDLVLLDLTMPFMDGEETFERLKTIRPDVSVLLNAGFIEQERLDRIVRAGIAGFLRKPHGPDELVTNIRSVLQGIRRTDANTSVGSHGHPI